MPSERHPPAGAGSWSRRSFLTGSAAVAALALLPRRSSAAVVTAPRFTAYPFSLGIASGDPAPDGMVLWTRLAPEPLAPGGGLPSESIAVTWELADDEAMTRIVQEGTVVADPDWAHAVHVEVAGLRPDRWYWYRFHCGDATSPVGRTRTLPAAGTTPERLRFAFASCQKYEIGHYTAYEHMAREELDLVVHLGDYIYEKGDGANAVRPHGTPEIFTLEDYRRRYAVYKSDLHLQAAHALAPWIATWDDHEVSNNYAGGIPEHPDQMSPEDFLRRRAAGYRAYFEHMPLRRSARPTGPDMVLHRRLDFGRLAAFHVLDTRQYRTDQPQGDGTKPPAPVLLDPAGTLLGAAQREWLFDGLAQSAAAWNVLAQQVLMARVDLTPGPEVGLPMDKWSGYEYERRRLLAHFAAARVANPVVITGDIHCNWANELGPDFETPDAAPVAVEFAGTSITSGGDGGDHGKYTPAALQAENPGVRFFNNERGYVRCEVTPEHWRTDYRTVAYVSRPGAPLQTRASFVVESGQPRLQSA